MSTEQDATLASVTEGAKESFLERAISVTSQTPEDATKTLLSVLTTQALEGTVTWDKNLTLTINKAIVAIDQKISLQLAPVLQNAEFRKLEGSWLGLHKLIINSDLGSNTSVKVKLVDYTKEELIEQFEEAPSIDRSRFFNMVYQEEFGSAGGLPYSVLIGDYEFGYGGEDVAFLRYMAEVAAASHAPFIAAVGAAMFDYSKFATFLEGKPVAAGFEGPAYGAWNAFRESDDARYVVLTLPKTLARVPYGAASTQTKLFHFEELPLRDNGQQIVTSEDNFVWSNSAYEYGEILIRAFVNYGWCTAIRGAENGGKITAMPYFSYFNEANEQIQVCPTQINFTDEREKELSDLGFLPLVHYKNTANAVFIGAQSTFNPGTYADSDDNANAAIAARIPYTMATSRVAHNLKIMGRDLVGSSLSAEDIQKVLSSWINTFVNPSALTNAAKAKMPLREAKVTVVEQAGRPGAFSAVAYLRPWLQMEELTTSLRMVANIPG